MRTRQNYASSYDRHIGPRLGQLPLREIDAETIATFQGDLIRDGVKPYAIRKAMILIGAILQRAAEGRRIPYNPQRVVRKARLPASAEVRPLAPVTVERLRAELDLRSATLVSVMAYGGLRPGETRTMDWSDARERSLVVNAEKTGQRRSVRPLDALAENSRRGGQKPVRRPTGRCSRPGRRGLDRQCVREVAATQLRRSGDSNRPA